MLSRSRRSSRSNNGPVGVHRRLTVLYVLALTAIALLSIGAQVWIHRALARQQNDARVINLAGRQRMLSQRISKNALILALEATPADKQSARAQLTGDFADWQKVNGALQSGDEKLGLPGDNSPATTALFGAMQPDYQTIVSATTAILAGGRGADAVAPILRSEKPWVKNMDKIVFGFDAEATARVERLKRTELILLALTLTVLMSEALLIFRPSARQIRALVQEMNRAQSRQRAMLEALPDAMLLFDADGRVIEAYPPAARELVGPGEINFARHLKAARAVGSAKSWEFADEAGHTLEARLVPLQDGELQGGLALVRDVSQLKEVETLKSDFIATVSHELRTPLTAIRGSLGLLGGGVMGEMGPVAENLVKVSLSNVERLTRLVNDILDLERINSGQLRLALEKTDFDKITLLAIEANRIYAREFNVTIEWQPGAPRAMLRTDADRITQIFTNLLSNAVKFSPRGGSVVVKTRRRRDEFGLWLRAEICDTGAGIPLEFQKRIFGKFAQADSSDARAAQGTGLGLSIARALTEQLGGHIGFESEPGRGTTFWCEWPETSHIKPKIAEVEIQAEVLVA